MAFLNIIKRIKINHFTLEKVNNYWLEDTSSVIILLILLFLIFLFPILNIYNNTFMYLNYFVFIFLYFSGIFSSYNKWIKFFLGFIFFIYVILKYNRVLQGHTDFYTTELFVSLISIFFMIFNNIMLLFRDQKVNVYRIIGAINVYLLLSVFGAVCLMLINQYHFPVLKGDIVIYKNDNDFSAFIYYSLASITTVGYGELFPANVFSRQLSVFLSTFGMLYPALVITKLLNLTK